jgi:molybdopterin synthase catalytic subunit
VQLEYEAYDAMVQKECVKICNEARSKWPQILHICMHHRIGIVPAGETSIIIAVSSPHRRDALDGVEWLLDELKLKAPIWKKEVYSDGSTWKDNKHP